MESLPPKGPSNARVRSFPILLSKSSLTLRFIIASPWAMVASELGSLALAMARMSSIICDGLLITQEAARPALADTKSRLPIVAGAASHEAMPCRGPLKLISRVFNVCPGDVSLCSPTRNFTSENPVCRKVARSFFEFVGISPTRCPRSAANRIHAPFW